MNHARYTNAAASWRRRAREGFTLVELLVVIGIVALLVAMLLPSLNGARRAAKSVACQSNLRQIAIAAQMYAQEQKRYVGWLAGVDRKMLLYPYLRQGTSNSDISERQVWHCPDNLRPDMECGYGFNTNLNWVRLSQIRNWSRTVAICDAGLLGDGTPTLTTMASPPSKLSSPTPSSVYRPNPRHVNRKVNVAMVDGHVEPMEMVEPFYPGPFDQWQGNGMTDPQNPNFKDHLWIIN